ncbi:MAG: hypothetical protein AAGA27_07210 [Pseudomonadota bacterium]
MSISNSLREDIVGYLQRCEFRALCDNYCHDNFLWTIKGSSLLSGTYHNKETFFTDVIGRLSNVLKGEWKMNILDTYVDNNTMIIEMVGNIKAKNDKNYNNEYCWIFKFDNNKIVSITAYYDSLLVNTTLNENENH